MYINLCKLHFDISPEEMSLTLHLHVRVHVHVSRVHGDFQIRHYLSCSYIICSVYAHI